MIDFTSLKSWMLTAMLCMAGGASAQTELLQNASFEEWNEEKPVHWVTASSAGNGTLSQSEDARTGAYSVEVAGASSNKRIGYEEMTLLPGSYTFTVYAKAATAEGASCRAGYALIKEDGTADGQGYKYGDYVNELTTESWSQASYEFTLEEETRLCLVVMNSKNPGKALLLDDASLTTMDGGIVEGGGEEPEPEPEPSAVIFKEAFDASLGGFTIDDVKPAEGLDGPVWTFDSRYGAKATSYTGGQDGEDIPTESWLISPSIDLTNVKAATLTFDHACNYFNDVKTDVTVWVREGSDGEWISLEIPTYPTSWTFVSSGDVDLSAYVGKSIQIGFKYVCTEKAGTYELKNFVIEERATGEEPVQPGNDSSKENPYSVAQAIAKYDASTAQAEVWVKGVIVGFVNGQSLASGSIFGAEAPEGVTKYDTNLLIADNASETDYTKCLVIQLPSGNVREALNLQDNPSNLGKTVTLMGSLEKYFGTYGLKSVSDYVLEGGETPEPQPTIDFAKVTAVTSAKQYVLAVVSDEVTAVAKPLTSAYGYLNVDNVSVSDNVVKVNPANAFTITETDGGYTIQDAQGRYMYMTGNFNSFNVSETLPESGYVWTVEFDADGLATITNVEKGKWIQYSTAYSSFGVYAETQDGGILPTLFMAQDGSGVADVNADVTNAPVEVYTLGGVKVGNSLDGLQKGIYIVKQGNEVKKVLK